MTQSLKKQAYQKAFTIVELLVVIVIIGILASISLVSYTGISNKATEASVISDLDNTVKQFKLFQVENSGYPATIDCAQPNSTTNKCIKLSGSNTLANYSVGNLLANQTFCVTIKNGSNIKKNITQDGIIANGTCPFDFASTLIAAASSRSQINLNWSAVTVATSYSIERSLNPSFSGSTVVYTGLGTSITSANLQSSTTYYYRINAIVDGDTSLWSSAASSTTLDFTAPSNLVVTAKTVNSISLSWSAVAGATGYKLQYSNNPSFTSPTDINTAANTVIATSSAMSAGTYYYRLNVTDIGGTSIWSATLTTATQLTQSFTTIGANTWNIPANITFVQIEAYGAQGGTGGYSTNYGSGGGAGGNGGKVIGNLQVNGGQLILFVGQVGANAPSDSSGGVGGNTTVSRSGTLLTSAYGGSGGGPGTFWCTLDENGGCYNDFRAVTGNTGAVGSGNFYTPITGGNVSNGIQSGNGRINIYY